MARDRFPKDVMDFLQTFAELPGLLIRLEAQLDANTKALNQALEQLGTTRLYERDAAKYLNVGIKAMYHYRNAGLPYEKSGRTISYLRKDLDEWRLTSRTQKLRNY